MRLLHLATSISLVSISFFASTPAIARWQYITKNHLGQELYIKDVVCRGPICEADWMMGSKRTHDTSIQINCRSWTYRTNTVIGDYAGLYREFNGTETPFETLGPRDVFSSIAENVCR